MIISKDRVDIVRDLFIKKYLKTHISPRQKQENGNQKDRPIRRKKLHICRYQKHINKYKWHQQVLPFQNNRKKKLKKRVGKNV